MSPGFAELQPLVLGLAVELRPDGEGLVQAVHTSGTVQDEEGNSGEHQNDGEVVLLVLALLHRLLSPQHPSATILLCYSVQALTVLEPVSESLDGIVYLEAEHGEDCKWDNYCYYHPEPRGVKYDVKLIFSQFCSHGVNFVLFKDKCCSKTGGVIVASPPFSCLNFHPFGNIDEE